AFERAQARRQADRGQSRRQPETEGRYRGQLQRRGSALQERRTLRIDGIILAGGASARMGAHKPLMPFLGKTLIDAVIARVSPQVDRLAIDVPREMVGAYRYPNVVPDMFNIQRGPLCGIVTGLQWLEGDWLA